MIDGHTRTLRAKAGHWPHFGGAGKKYVTKGQTSVDRVDQAREVANDVVIAPLGTDRARHRELARACRRGPFDHLDDPRTALQLRDSVTRRTLPLGPCRPAVLPTLHPQPPSRHPQPRPGNCEGIAGNRYVGAFRPVGCCPAVRARHDVLAVPADVGARLTAISYEQAERKREAAQAALGYLRRPQTVALRGCWWFRRHQARTGRKLSGSGFGGHRRNC